MNFMKIFSSIVALILVNTVMQAQVSFIAHRGASFLAPENTVSAARLAWKLGADGVEIDIQLTADQKIMVIHDANTKRTSGEDFVIKNSSSKKLRKLDVGSFKDEKYKGEKIPYLKEIIATVSPGKKLVVEIKCGKEVLPFLEKVVNKSRKKDQMDFISFDWQVIVLTKKMFPENKCYWLSSKKEGLKEKAQEAVLNKLDGLDLYFSIIDEETVQLSKQLNLGLMAWTVDNPTEAKRLVDLGVNSLTTNKPDWLKVQLDQ